MTAAIPGTRTKPHGDHTPFRPSYRIHMQRYPECTRWSAIAGQVDFIGVTAYALYENQVGVRFDRCFSAEEAAGFQ